MAIYKVHQNPASILSAAQSASNKVVKAWKVYDGINLETSSALSQAEESAVLSMVTSVGLESLKED